MKTFLWLQVGRKVPSGDKISHCWECLWVFHVDWIFSHWAAHHQKSNRNLTEIQQKYKDKYKYKSLLVFHGWPCRLNLFTWSSTNGNHHRLVLWLLHYRILSITYRFFSLWTCITSTQFKTKCKYDYIYTDTNNIRLVIVIIWGLKCRVWDGIFSLGAATRIF